MNAIQDQYADLTNLSQAVSVASVTIGAAGLTFSQFAAGVMGLAGTLRASNVVNAVNGFQVNGTALASTHLSDSATIAHLAAPAFTGNPTAATPAQDDNDTSLATTAYVIGQLSTSTPVMDGVGAVGTSLRMARADHVHPSDTSRAPLASPALTGTPTAPTPTAGDVSTKLATTAFVAAGGSIAGEIKIWPGPVVPSGFLKCDGSAQSRATFPNLFNALVANKGAATVTIASPGVWTLTSHGFNNGDVIYVETTGALPTGLSADTAYYIVAATTNTFQVSSTLGGAGINTSGTQSGTHTVFYAPWAEATMSSTTFNIPDMTGRIPVGQNAGTFKNLGGTGGEESHPLVIAELAAHDHGGSTSAVSAGTPAGTVTVGASGILTTGTESADHTHSGTTSGHSVTHTHNNAETRSTVNGQSYGAGSFPYATNILTSVTTGESTDHSHNFTSGGRSAAHTHDLASHTHTGSFAGTALGTHSHTITSQGSGTAHNNIQPYQVVTYIIKT